ncbi:gamma carbonic anhydrase family protein [bacterium]|nr:gamma carbonic anhydrase family protein [bacterium]
MLKNQPKISPTAFIAPQSTVFGNVELEDETSIWFGAVLRGDGDQIKVGARSNIQDNAVVHVDPGDPVNIGEDCTIGHAAIVHGATLKDRVLVGMNSVILNNAVIGEDSLIGACALVTAGTNIPPRSLVLGSPAKVVRSLSDEEVAGLKKSAEGYVKKSREFIEYYKKNPASNQLTGNSKQ